MSLDSALIKDFPANEPFYGGFGASMSLQKLFPEKENATNANVAIICGGFDSSGATNDCWGWTHVITVDNCTFN